MPVDYLAIHLFLSPMQRLLSVMLTHPLTKHFELYFAYETSAFKGIVCLKDLSCVHMKQQTKA